MVHEHFDRVACEVSVSNGDEEKGSEKVGFQKASEEVVKEIQLAIVFSQTCVHFSENSIDSIEEALDEYRREGKCQIDKQRAGQVAQAIYQAWSSAAEAEKIFRQAREVYQEALKQASEQA